MNRRIELLISDPLNDFCELPQFWHSAESAHRRGVAVARAGDAPALLRAEV